MTKTMITKTASNLYSRDRNAIAPSRMAFPMNRTCSLPSSDCIIFQARYAAKASATTPATIARIKISNGFLRKKAPPMSGEALSD